MRPQTLEQYIGQQHILGPDKPLRKAILAGHCHSMILWGPPGTGKTTLAELMAHYCQAEVERLSAVTSGIKEIRAAIDKAKENSWRGVRTILFVDEVHRFNKSQQDVFLPHIEDGTITFIGATTENPSFELNNALLSRARVYLLKRLEEEDILTLIDQAMQDARGLNDPALTFAPGVKEALAKAVDGTGASPSTTWSCWPTWPSPTAAATSLSTAPCWPPWWGARGALRQGGDHFYDLISAVHKSIRGSAPDAALYWYARMVSAGCDPLYIARRLLAIASEDVGNADPRAMQVALSAWDCFHRIGPAEGSGPSPRRSSISPVHPRAMRSTPPGRRRFTMPRTCRISRCRRTCATHRPS